MPQRSPLFRIPIDWIDRLLSAMNSPIVGRRARSGVGPGLPGSDVVVVGGLSLLAAALLLAALGCAGPGSDEAAQSPRPTVEPFAAHRIDRAGELAVEQPTAIAVFAGRTFIASAGALPAPERVVSEWFSSDYQQPYPDASWQRYNGFERTSGIRHFVHPTAMARTREVDVHGTTCDFLWVLDSGRSPAYVDRARCPAGLKIVKINADTNAVANVFYIDTPDLDPLASFNAMQIDPVRHRVFLADGRAPGLFVFDLDGLRGRYLLVNHPAMRPDPGALETVADPALRGELASRDDAGVSHLALSEDREWLYFAAALNRAIYRVPTSALLEQRATDGRIAPRIQTVVPTRSVIGAMVVHPGGELVIAERESGAIAAHRPGIAPRWRTLVADDRLRDVAALAFDDGGGLHAAVAAGPTLVPSSAASLGSGDAPGSVDPDGASVVPRAEVIAVGPDLVASHLGPWPVDGPLTVAARTRSRFDATATALVPRALPPLPDEEPLVAEARPRFNPASTLMDRHEASPPADGLAEALAVGSIIGAVADAPGPAAASPPRGEDAAMTGVSDGPGLSQ